MSKFIAVHIACVHIGNRMFGMQIADSKPTFHDFNRMFDYRFIVRFPLDPLLAKMVSQETIVIIHSDDDLLSLGMDIDVLRHTLATALIECVIDGNDVYEDTRIILDGIAELS